MAGRAVAAMRLEGAWGFSKERSLMYWPFTAKLCEVGVLFFLFLFLLWWCVVVCLGVVKDMV